MYIDGISVNMWCVCISGCCLLFTLGGCLKEYKCIKWTGADISTIYDVSDYLLFAELAEYPEVNI